MQLAQLHQVAATQGPAAATAMLPPAVADRVSAIQAGKVGQQGGQGVTGGLTSFAGTGGNQASGGATPAAGGAPQDSSGGGSGYGGGNAPMGTTTVPPAGGIQSMGPAAAPPGTASFGGAQAPGGGAVGFQAPPDAMRQALMGQLAAGRGPNTAFQLNSGAQPGGGGGVMRPAPVQQGQQLGVQPPGGGARGGGMQGM